ncbi:MAG: ATP-binding protein [Candidatus Micrarchaeota archaeon]
METLLTEQNPWWHDRNAISADRDIVNYSNASFKIPLPALRAEKGVIVIRGPRQVGKTTFLKHLAAKEIGLLGPRQVFYFSAESGYPLDKALREFLDFSGEGKRVLLIDEATEDKEWATKVKYLLDSGKMRESDLIVITGSSSVDLKAGADRLPGRGVEGNEFLFFPYSFRDFFPSNPEGCGLADFSEKAAKELALDPQNSIMFAKYISNGGLPSVWNTERELARERYARWIEGFISKNGRSILYAREILAKLAEKTTFDFMGLARETSISSHHTIEGYVSFFEAGMLGRLLYNYNLATSSPDPKKEKKFVFIDPFISQIFISKREEPFLVEDIVGSHLLRACDELYFHRDKKGEVDFLCKAGGKLVPVEVKWQEKVAESDARNLKKFGGGFLLTKDFSGRFGNVLAVPVPVFLRMIGRTMAIRKPLGQF